MINNSLYIEFNNLEINKLNIVRLLNIYHILNIIIYKKYILYFNFFCSNL